MRTALVKWVLAQNKALNRSELERWFIRGKIS